MGVEVLDIGEVVVETPKGARRAMVLTPREHVRVGRERLSDASERTLSEVDRRIIAEIEQRNGEITAVVFRGSNDDQRGSWGFDPGLDVAESNALAVKLLEGMVVVFRKMLEAGVCVHAHSDWGPVEARAFRHANGVLIERYGEQLAKMREDDPARRDLELELWTLRNLTFYFTLGFSTLVASVLPEKLPLLELRTERVRAKLAERGSGSLLVH